ncbi:hypothetical protein BUQ74_06225 [Leptospira weilii serovar Heyan]|nr:hypothetical protein BUQ74_06225 [Leptospira weilii serovar Heyan]
MLIPEESFQIPKLRQTSYTQATRVLGQIARLPIVFVADQYADKRFVDKKFPIRDREENPESFHQTTLNTITPNSCHRRAFGYKTFVKYN